MKIDAIHLRELQLPLLRPFQTSFGTTTVRRILLAEVQADGVSGWGEVTAKDRPIYNEEFVDASWFLLKDQLGPKLLAEPLENASQTANRLRFVRGHYMTRGGLEVAVWDLEAKLQKMPLWKHIGGEKTHIECGVSIGVQKNIDELLELIQKELDAGYHRIKIKIMPGWDVDVVREVRERFPDIRLLADANSAYTLADTAHLKKLDDFDLMMIEQPLMHDDIIDHATLQKKLATPICLDEAIRAPRHAEQAIELGSCRVINIKLGRVGGFTDALLVHNIARAHGIPVWCGGMLEAGVGRAHNIALSTLGNFTLPGDVSASKRYWERDIIDPPVEVGSDGTITVPEGPGIGYGIDLDYIESLTVRRETIT